MKKKVVDLSPIGIPLQRSLSRELKYDIDSYFHSLEQFLSSQTTKPFYNIRRNTEKGKKWRSHM